MEGAFNLFLILFFSLSLVWATDLLISSLKILSEETKVGKFALTSFILALATSIPELVVGITAALEGKPALVLGNVLGSNIADLSLVIGGAALLGGEVLVLGEVFTRDMFLTFLVSILPIFLLLDKTLSRLDGAVLLFLYLFYQFTVLRGKRKETRGRGWIKRLLKRLVPLSGNHKREWANFFLGAALLLLSADLLVKSAAHLASSFLIPLLLIGLFLVAVGTSLPELSFEISAIKRREVGMVFGDLLGSVVANSSLILGVTSLLHPVKISAFEDFLLATTFFVFIFGLFYFFTRTKRKLERWEGAVLLFLYLTFALVELLR